MLVDILEKFWEIWEKKRVNITAISGHAYEDFLVLDVDLVLCFYFEKQKYKSSVEICANDLFDYSRDFTLFFCI